MKRILLSTVSFVLSLGIATPGFAYFSVPGNSDYSGADRQTRRAVMQDARAMNRLPDFIPTNDRMRSEASEKGTTGHTLLRRADGRQLRRFNRARKPGYDRYRTLNLRSNKRSLRGMEYESFLELPRTLVLTGGYDKPTRRDIRDNMYFGVNDRDRNILQEIEDSNN